MILFLCLPGISLGRYCQKILVKNKGGVESGGCGVGGGGVLNSYSQIDDLILLIV